MTWFLNFRSQCVGGPAIKPRMMAGDAHTGDALTKVSDHDVRVGLEGRDVLLVTHGFNVSQVKGIRCLSRLEAYLQPRGNELFIGILWPGDYWLPVINYPAEAADAVQCGNWLADYCNQHLRTANSLSLASHSLGGRLILQAVVGLNLPRKPRSVCLTAAAVDWDCLNGQYAQARDGAEAVMVLSSRFDHVLKLAYPAGDLLSDFFFGDSDDPFTAALGLKGPKRISASHLRSAPIPKDYKYDHGDYLPSSSSSPPSSTHWHQPADFIGHCFRRGLEAWNWPP